MLTRTIEILESQDPTLKDAISEYTSLPKSTDDSAGIIIEDEAEYTERDIAKLSKELGAARARLMPLTQQLRPHKQNLSDITEEYESKKKVLHSS